MSPSDFEKCKERGCLKMVNNSKGVCIQHRRKLCQHPGCAQSYEPKSDGLRLCKKHRQLARVVNERGSLFNGGVVYV
jgi:hypothetical protein